MSRHIDYCPFCGNDEDSDDGIEIVVETHTQLNMPTVYLKCGHCAATSSRFTEETIYEAKLNAIDTWNQAGRLTWMQRNVTRHIGQLKYDVKCWIENIRDR